MSLTKRVSGDYNIVSADVSKDRVNITTKLLTVSGDLLVTGNSSKISATDTYIKDNFITLNAGETADRISLGQAGIEIDRGRSDNVLLKFNEESETWQGTDNGVDFYNLNPELNISKLFDDKSPKLGNSLDVNDFAITSSGNGDIVLHPSGNGQIKLNTSLSLERSTEDPEYDPLYNKLYAKEVGNGGTGLYVKSQQGSTAPNVTPKIIEDELVSRSKALAYSIIF